MTEDMTIEQLELKLNMKYAYHQYKADQFLAALEAIKELTSADISEKIKVNEECHVTGKFVDIPSEIVFPAGKIQAVRAFKLREMCIDILKEAHRPLGVNEIAYELNKTPVKFNYKALSSTIFATIRKDDRFERINQKGTMTKWKLRDKENDKE